MPRSRHTHPEPAVDLSTRVGSVALPNPVMTASGTAGHGAELDAYVELSGLGAVVVKSLSPGPWPGNPAPRLRPTPAGMVNSIGLQGPGLRHWLDHELPDLAAAGARVVVSLWGRTIDDYAEGAALLSDAPDTVVAVEVNVSCPNLKDGTRMFAQSPTATHDALAATEGCGRPRWAKLSPAVADLVEIGRAAVDGGAEALTLVNTVPGMVIDLDRRRPALGGGGGGLSGPAVHPVAVRAVYECRAALPDVGIVGVGGVVDGETAIELILAGADAVQVGTASFADPRACARVRDGVARWCRDHGVSRVAELRGAAHDRN